MENLDIQRTRQFRELAREVSVGMKLNREEVFVGKPHRTLLLRFVNVAATINTPEQMNRTFPLLVTDIRENYGNNPLAYDWESLAIAVDNHHGHYVYGAPLNTP